jgi:tight adherence protein B
VVSTALLLLIAAVACFPHRIAAARLTALWPSPRPRNSRSWRFGGPVVVGAVTGLLTAGPGGALAGALLAVTVARARADRAARTAATAGATELADALQRITDELRAGSHPAVALAGVTADGPVAARLLTPAATAARLGDDVPAALRRGQDTAVTTELGRVAAAWSLAERHGVPLADVLARVHDDIRWRVRFGASVQALLAGPRATAGVLTALPGLGVALGQLLGADPIGVLRAGPLGQVLLVVGIGLVAAGRAWTDQILRRAVPR